MPDNHMEDVAEEEGLPPFPKRMEVCHVCNGRGTALIRSLQGIDVTESCREDPDFRDDYMNGMYDTVCYKCGGKNVLEVLDYERMTTEQKDFVDQWDYEESIAASERARGA